MQIGLPSVPEPTEIEIEITNYCNAHCLACPRNMLSAPRGLMNEETYVRTLEIYSSFRVDMSINQVLGRDDYPIITIAGLGEPTLHPTLPSFVKQATSEKFKVILFSNGSRLDSRLGEKLIESGLNCIYVSFWGITKEEYEAAMGLNFTRTLANVERLSQLCHKTMTRLVVCWIQTPLTQSTPEEVLAFWSDRGIEVDMSEFLPWNRGGLLKDSRFQSIFDKYKPMDPSRPIWCSQLYFTDTITWEGNIVLCSQDYFQREYILGNVHSIKNPLEISQAKAAILKERPLPAMCQACRKPDRNYRFGSEPWDRVLSEEQRRLYDYDLDLPLQLKVHQNVNSSKTSDETCNNKVETSI